MKITNLIVAAMTVSAVLAGCGKNVQEGCESKDVNGESGMLSVRLMYDGSLTKSGEATDYLDALEEEKAVKKVSVLVFDEGTGMLNASKEIGDVTDECKMTIPVGRKTVYAVVNGPDLGSITNIGQMAEIADDLSLTDMAENGLTMIGRVDCDVHSGMTSEPTVTVRWLVSRVVLKRLACKIAPQYGEMTVDCVYLGNANSIQYGSGEVDGMVNPDGYADAGKTRMIGKTDVFGECPGYMYRGIGADILVDDEHDTPYHLYCQPNASSEYTCMYILTTIGGVQYYYRVPLDKGLEANQTCSVEAVISNLGSLTPPEGDYQNGAIQATVQIEGWTAGNSYVAEF